MGKGSFLVSRIGEWLLLLLSLWNLLNLVLAVSNSWDLLIPGVSFLLLTSRSISWSSIVNVEDGELGLCAN
uniref:Putative ovule protein n=1 Tax=Solanum chacoense TaxID=4108 RepID=A0A0V0H3V6_SOLCH